MTKTNKLPLNVYRSLIVKKSEGSIVHAVALGYKWLTPQSRLRPGKFIMLDDEGFITNITSNDLRYLRFRGPWIKVVRLVNFRKIERS